MENVGSHVLPDEQSEAPAQDPLQMPVAVLQLYGAQSVGLSRQSGTQTEFDASTTWHA